MSKNGGWAFPAMHFDLGDEEHGMTLRDYFAAKAMQGLLSSASWRDGMDAANTASAAYALAGAMLAERDK